MTRRWVWALGVAACVLAILASALVASALPLGYDSRAYWLAGRHLVAGEPLYPAVGAPLGQPGEFHYLPLVAVPFVVLAPLPLEVATALWLVVQLALAVAIAVVLIRPLPADARPWAAAAYAFFLPLVLEIGLGNLNLATLALVLLAWHWRDRRVLGPPALAAGIGVKLLPLILLPFYLAAARWRIVRDALLAGSAALVLSAPFLWDHTRAYLAILPAYAGADFAREAAQRDEPAFLAAIVWSGAFPTVLRIGALALAVWCGIASRRDPERATDWHHLALALSPYLLPFGFIWTTFLVLALPLFAASLRRALALGGAPRIAGVAGLAACWAAMLVVQVRDLYPIVSHLVGSVGLVAISLALLALERRQALGRSTPFARATRIASG